MKISRPVKAIVEVVLLGLLVLLFVKVLDVQRLRLYFSLITTRVILGILAFQLAILLLQACQWALVLREAGIYRGLWKTLLARTSGFALMYLTPSLYFGGEPIRASLYKDAGMSYQKVYASIALDKYIELASKLPCIIVGFSYLIFLAHPGTTLIVVSSTILLGFIALFLFLIARLFGGAPFIVRFFKGMLRPLARIKPRLAIRALRAIREFAVDLHALIKRKRIFYSAILIGIFVAVVEVFQTLYILAVLGGPDLAKSFVIFSSVVIQGLIGILPGNLGGMEGTHLFVFNILGIGSDRSLVYTIILRIGQLTMVSLGILNVFAWRIAKLRRRGADRIRTDA
jgi:uncharacterized protein (TIRG00374 family)